MKIETHSFEISTKGFNDIIDITSNVEKLIVQNNFSEGSALVFVSGATAGITTIEYEPGLLKDYPELMEKLIPSNKNYHHDNTWHDGNGFSHLRASLQGASFTVPFKDKKLILGTWQQIILIDFDNRPRKRKITVQLIGE
ncbi:MAG: secondary thiamine-phosphate synthase enzyme YjbQ [Melioribacteraceae bacterium]|nr:secondary thiamine-phosphate synthase enzyme YjbQ [Melioribacteraceae bacterium]